MKKWYQSKTVIIGLLTASISLLTFFQGQEFISSNPELVSAVGTVLGVLTIIIRFFTDTPMKGTT